MFTPVNQVIARRQSALRIPMRVLWQSGLQTFSKGQNFHFSRYTHTESRLYDRSMPISEVHPTPRGRKAIRADPSRKATETKAPSHHAFMDLIAGRAESTMYKKYTKLFKGPSGEDYSPVALNIQDALIRIADHRRGNVSPSVTGVEHSLYHLYEINNMEKLFSQLLIEVSRCFTGINTSEADTESLSEKRKRTRLDIISTGAVHSEIFTHDELKIIMTNETVKQLLWKLIEMSHQNHAKTNARLLTVGDIFNWIESLLLPTIRGCSFSLRNSVNVPVQVLYDVLLRTPKDEYEWKVMLGIHKTWSTRIVQLDDLRSEHALALEKTATDNRRRAKYPKRTSKLPFAFQNLFFHALRHNEADLVELLNRHLSTTNRSKVRLLQVSELMWNISIQILLQGSNQNRHLKEAYLLLVKYLNTYLKKYEGFDADVTTMVAVSIYSYTLDKMKSKEVFQLAEKRFQKWILESFDIDGFERVLSHNADPITGRIKQISISDLRLERGDLEAKLLCASILLSDKASEVTYDKIFQILNTDDNEFLECYPEIWRISLYKLDERGILTSDRSVELWKLYLKSNSENYDPYIFDILMKNVSDLKESHELINLANEYNIHLDTVNFSKLMTQYYTGIQATKDRRTGLFDSPLSVSRYLNYYCDNEFRVINRSFILGESIVDSRGAYERYQHVENQPSEHDIMSLLLASIQLKRELPSDVYETISWNGLVPHDRAINDFEIYTQHSYMDDEKLVYPTDRLWLAYIQLLLDLNEEEKLVNLLYRWVDLQYPVSEKMMTRLLSCFPVNEAIQFLRCCHIYNERYMKLQSLQPLSEMELKVIKKNQPPLPPVSRRFEIFVDFLDNNYEIIKYWSLPEIRSFKAPGFETEKLNSKSNADDVESV